MKPNTYKWGFVVEVEPDDRYFQPGTDSDKLAGICEDIKRDIRRHVDCVGSVCTTTTTYCGYCHCEYELATDGCPMCCDKAIEDWDKNKEQA